MDIGSLTGAIIIGDQFSSVITLGISKVKEFAESFDEMTGGLGTASVLAVGAIGAVTTAIIALGEHGADVNDVSDTLVHFSGSAEAAKANLDGLRTGVKGTVDDFALMKDQARLLSAGVKLNAQDFTDLGAAAFVLQNRGLGPTGEMLDLVSNALVTGRTRQLAMKLGVVDNANALDDYAHKLGLAKDELTKAQTAEATRITVMNMLRSATKDAGDQQLDFGERMELVIAKVKNWTDEVASAVAKSPDISKMLDALGDGFKQVFGDSTKTMQEIIVEGINKFARAVTAAIPYVVSFANGIKSIGQFIVDNKTIIETGIQVVGAFAAGWVVWSVGGALVTGIVAGLAAVTTGITAITAAALANPFTAAAVAATAAGLAISYYANSQADAALATQVAGAKADAAAIATKRLATAHDDVKKAVEAAAPPVTEMSKAAQSLYDSFFKAGNALNAITPAVGAVSDKMLQNRAVQEAVVAELDKLIAAGVTLTARQNAIYDGEIKTTLALHEKSVEMANASKLTLDNISVLERQGLSEKEIAFMLKISVDALKLRKTTLKDLTDFEQTALKMSTEMWRTYTETVNQLTNTEFDNKYDAIEQWAEKESTKIEEQAKKMKLAGQDTTDFLTARYSELATTIAAKYQTSFLDVKKIQDTNTNDTLRGLQQTADARKRDFEYAMTQLGVWSDDTINKTRTAYEAAQQAVDSWRTDHGSSLDQMIAKQDQLTSAINTTTNAMKSFQLVGTPTPDKFKGVSTFQLQSQGYLDAKGQVTASGQAAGLGFGPSYSSFDSGGPVVGDQIAKVHDGEYVVPKQGVLVKGGSGNTVVNVSVQAPLLIANDRMQMQQVGGWLSDALVVDLRSKGLL